MKEKIEQYLNKTFAAYQDFPAKDEVIQELLANLMDKYNDLKELGKTDEEAYNSTIDSIGDVSEIVNHSTNSDAKSEKKDTLSQFLSEMAQWIGINHDNRFKGINLKKSDLMKAKQG